MIQDFKNLDRDSEITVKIINWQDLVGKTRHNYYLRATFNVNISSDLDFDNYTLGAYWRLVALAGTSQKREGSITETARCIASAIRVRPDRLHRLLTVLTKKKLIQVLVNTESRNERDKIDIENVPSTDFLTLKGATKEEWQILWALMPAEIKFDLGIPNLEYARAFLLAATNKGSAFRGINLRGIPHDAAHIVTDEIFDADIRNNFPGEFDKYSDFAKSYCRLFIHDARGLFFLLACIEGYASHLATDLPVTAGLDVKTWLSGDWWSWFVEPTTGERRKKFEYCGGNPVLKQLAAGKDIIYQIGQ